MEQKKWKGSVKDILGYSLLGISVVMLGRSLMLCFSNDIWYDELFTVGMIEHSYGELIGFTARDVHPPLYYMITKAFVDLWKMISPAAGTVMAAKVVSVLPYFILLLYCVTFIRRRFGIFTGGFFIFCAIAMPQLSGYTVEVRMYSWALLFVTAALLHAYGTLGGYVHPETCTGDAAAGEDKAARVQKLHGAALVCYGLAAAYTQYFACVAVIMVYLYVLIVLIYRDRGRIKEWLLWVFVSVLGYVPWLFALYSQIAEVNSGYWILPLSWRTFGGCVKFLMKPAFTDDRLSTVLAVIFSAVWLGVFLCEGAKFRCHRRRKQTASASENAAAPARGEETLPGQEAGMESREGRFGLMLAGTGVPAGLVLFGFAASMLVRPIFVYRYMIPAMGCFWLGFAAGLDDLWRPAEECAVQGSTTGKGLHKYKLCKLICASVFLFTVLIGLRDYRAFMGEEEYKILLMEQAEEALSSIAPGDVVIYNFGQVQAVTSYYLAKETDSYLWRGTPETLIQDIIRPYGVAEETGQIRSWCREGRTVWFIGSFNSRDEIVAEWAADGIRAEEAGSYLLERYWFNLYKISI